MEKKIKIERDDIVLFHTKPIEQTVTAKYYKPYIVKVLSVKSAYAPNDPHMFSGYSNEYGVDDKCWLPYIKKNYGKMELLNIHELMEKFPEDFI